MNIQHLRYALEVAKTRSISRAAANLYMAQPNLSRAIRDLEESLGITLFRRSPQGIQVTPQGEEFLVHARDILSHIEQVEFLYSGEHRDKAGLSVSVPRSAAVALAFVEFASEQNQEEPFELRYRETNATGVLDDVFSGNSNLGLLLYQKDFEQHFQAELIKRDLKSRLLGESRFVLTMSRRNPLSQKETITREDLADGIELILADVYTPTPLQTAVSRTCPRNILLFERATQFGLLNQLPNSFQWGSPVPQEVLAQFSLTQRACDWNDRIMHRVLICRSDYRLSEPDQRFLAILEKYSPEI